MPTTPPDRATPASIHVCALSLVPQMLVATGARHLVTLIGGDELPDTPAQIEPANHLKLALHDITAPQEGRVTPGESHIRELLTFVARWDRKAPMLIHCWAGISRSTAGAFISLCALNPGISEHKIAERLRQASPTADPNRLMLRHADKLLDRKGRMLAAVEAMTERERAAVGRPFGLPSRIS